MAGLRLDDLGSPSLSWVDLRDFLYWAPRDSAFYRAMNPGESHLTPELEFAREAAFWLEVLVWQQTADGQKGRNAPKRVPLSQAERLAMRPKGQQVDTMTRDEALKFLGWDRGGRLAAPVLLTEAHPDAQSDESDERAATSAGGDDPTQDRDA